MKTPDLIRLLTEFYSERLAIVLRHEAGARRVAQYDFNNTYQYVINREETHLQWLQSALRDVQTPEPGPARALDVPAGGKGTDLWTAIASDDARLLGEFVGRWKDRLETVTNARIRNMLRVILGESQEHKRFFDLMAAGNQDLLGTRTGGVPRQGAVMASRWIGD